MRAMLGFTLVSAIVVVGSLLLVYGGVVTKFMEVLR